MRWLVLISGILLAAPTVEAAPTWIDKVRVATARDDAARACAVPRIIRYHSTRALLRRAARDPERFSRAAVKAWRLRLLELKRAAQSCLVASEAKARAELVVEVDLPPSALADDWFDGEEREEVLAPAGPEDLLLVGLPGQPPDARPPVVSQN